MKNSRIILGLLSATILLVVVSVSCKKVTATDPMEILEQTPNVQQNFDYKTKHEVNNDLATLGRVLFYDKNLSLNNTTSCGSCHKQEFAFADNVRFNKGFNGINLERNSPSIQGIRGFISSNQSGFVINSAQVNVPSDRPTKENQIPVRLFWDGRQSNVADMVLNPVTNHKEMNIPDFATLIKKLTSISYYPDLFKKAYGDESITKERIAFAMQGFMACLNTQVKRKDVNAQPVKTFTVSNIRFTTTENLSPLEQQGLFLFHTKYNCAQCHKPLGSEASGGDVGYGGTPSSPTFRDFEGIVRNNTSFSNMMMSEVFNIGLDEKVKDKGLGAVSGLPADEGLFKVPTLHNISVTAPYMHDGRYATLNEVLDHYSHNIKNNRNLASIFRNTDGTAKAMNINATEKIALLAFLNTLKDDNFLTSPMYSDPFK